MGPSAFPAFRGVALARANEPAYSRPVHCATCSPAPIAFHFRPEAAAPVAPAQARPVVVGAPPQQPEIGRSKGKPGVRLPAREKTRAKKSRDRDRDILKEKDGKRERERPNAFHRTQRGTEKGEANIVATPRS